MMSVMVDRAGFARRGRQLQLVTIAWNSGEFLVAVAAGVVSGSIALIGFGFDSAIEVASSLAALWRLRLDGEPAARERAERRAVRVIGVCFVLLAGYVTWDAVASLVRRQAADVSGTGIVLAALSLLVMPTLVHFKRGVARALASGALAAESRQTEFCAYLSAILLAGLGLNAWLGWWWADPLAALVMAPLIAREGWAALRGGSCCASGHADVHRDGLQPSRAHAPANRRTPSTAITTPTPEHVEPVLTEERAERPDQHDRRRRLEEGDRGARGLRGLLAPAEHERHQDTRAEASATHDRLHQNGCAGWAPRMNVA